MDMLQECNIDFEVIQLYSSGPRGEKITLGHISLNLAEYVELSDQDGEDGITRRYLMQESKINSTLKIGISMKQLDGERNFIAPPLKTALVFGGITGIVDFEQTEDDPGRKSSSTVYASCTGILKIRQTCLHSTDLEKLENYKTYTAEPSLLLGDYKQENSVQINALRISSPAVTAGAPSMSKTK
jgi:hypothetical protein